MSIPTFRRRSIRSRTKIHKPDNDRELREIYGDGNGAMPDLSRFERRERTRLRTVAFALLLLFAFFGGVAWAGFFVFYSGNKATGSGVALTIDAPEQVVSGREVTWTIRYTNNERVPLGKVELDLYYPQHFVFAKADPEPMDDRKTRWQLGSMGVGDEGTVTLSGTLFDVPETQGVLRAVLVYKPANFNSEFESIASATTTIKETPLLVTINGPKEVSPGDLVSYTVRVKNITEETLDAFQVRMQYPSGFRVETAKPKTKSDDPSVWDVKTLASGKETTIQLDGRFSGDVGERSFRVTAERAFDEKQYVLAAGEAAMGVSKGDLVLELLVNGSPQSQSVDTDAVVPFSVNIKNASEHTLVDTAVIVELHAGVFNWKALQNPDKGVVDAGTIRWTKREAGELQKIVPGAEVTFNFSLPFVGRGNPVRAVATVTYLRSGDRQKAWELKSNTITLSGGSDFSLTRSVSVAGGSFPLDAGTSTTVRVAWALTHETHEFENIVVRTAVAPGITFTNQWNVSAGDLTYDASTGAIVWRVNKFALGLSEITASFDLTFTPSADDIGKAIPLTLKTTYEAQDLSLNAPVGGTTSPLTTALIQ